MRVLLPVERFVLHVGWLVPIFWMFKPDVLASLGVLFPAPVFLFFGLLTMAAGSGIDGLVSIPTSARTRQALEVGLMAGGACLIAVAPKIFVGVETWTQFLANLVLLMAASGWALRIRSQPETYDGLVSDFAFGTLALAFLTAVIYAVGNHISFGALTYLGITAYALIGVFGLSLSRRFASGEESLDQRDSAVDGDWLLATVIVLGGLTLLALILIQVLAFDVVGALGNATRPLQEALIWTVGQIGSTTINLLSWLGHVLGIHPSHASSKPHVTRPRQGPRRRRLLHPLHSKHASALVEQVLKVLGIVLAGTATLALAALGLRRAMGVHPRNLRGELRVSTWSWRAVLAWFFRRVKMEIAEVAPSIPHLPRPRRLRSVRDVYRAFLLVGRDRFRPKARGETGLEYSQQMQMGWTGSRSALEGLNELYARERYGGRSVTTEALKTATDDLREIETVTAHSSKA